MLDKLYTALHFAFRQKAAFTEMLGLIKALLTFKIPFKSILATQLTILELFSAAFLDTPITPHKSQLDLTGYELVFEDEFDGDSLNMDVWAPRALGRGRTTVASMSQVSVKDGNLVLTAQYREDGEYGPGWYTADLTLKQEYLRGYFEIRCKVLPNVSNVRDVWSAFWLSNNHAYDADISKGGVGSCEMDIMEIFSANSQTGAKPTSVVHAIWCNGVDNDPDSIDGRNFGRYYTQNDPVDEYNTYGFMWNEDEYIWYVNGVETVRSSYVNGVCQVPEQVIVSIANPSYDIIKDRSISGDYTIDYVRIYQIPEK